MQMRTAALSSTRVLSAFTPVPTSPDDVFTSDLPLSVAVATLFRSRRSRRRTGSIVPCDFELTWVDTTGDGRVAEMPSNGAMDDAGEGDAINGEGFLQHFIDVGTEVGGSRQGM